jgi:hypothetical protein
LTSAINGLMIRAVVDVPDEAGMLDQAALTEQKWGTLVPVMAGFDTPDPERDESAKAILLAQARRDIEKQYPGRQIAYIKPDKFEVRLNSIYSERAIVATFKYALVPE